MENSRYITAEAAKLKPYIRSVSSLLQAEDQPSASYYAIGQLLVSRTGAERLNRVSLPQIGKDNLHDITALLEHLGISDAELLKRGLAGIIIGIAFPQLLESARHLQFSTMKLFVEIGPHLKKLSVQPPTIRIFREEDSPIYNNDLLTTLAIRTQLNRPKVIGKVGDFFVNDNALRDLPSLYTLVDRYSAGILIPDVLVAGQIFQRLLDEA